jgi:lysozyme
MEYRTSYDLVKLRTSLIKHEGKKEYAYRDSLGYWTIGIGHFLGGGREVYTPRMTIVTSNEMDALLTKDIENAEGRLSDICSERLLYDWRSLDDVRQRVLVEMSFNLGYRLATFRQFFGALNARDWKTAADEMLDSQWAIQVGNRATTLARMIETGEDL